MSSCYQDSISADLGYHIARQHTATLATLAGELDRLSKELETAPIGTPTRLASTSAMVLGILLRQEVRRREAGIIPDEAPPDLSLLEDRYRVWSAKVDLATVAVEACGCATCRANLRFTQGIAGAVWSELQEGGRS